MGIREDVNCVACSRKLFIYKGGKVNLEIKCPRCKRIYYFCFN